MFVGLLRIDKIEGIVYLDLGWSLNSPDVPSLVGLGLFIAVHWVVCRGPCVCCHGESALSVGSDCGADGAVWAGTALKPHPHPTPKPPVPLRSSVWIVFARAGLKSFLIIML